MNRWDGLNAVPKGVWDSGAIALFLGIDVHHYRLVDAHLKIKVALCDAGPALRPWRITGTFFFALHPVYCPPAEAQGGSNRTGTWWLGQNDCRLIELGVWKLLSNRTTSERYLHTTRVNKNLLAHDPRDCILKRCANRIGMMRLSEKTDME